MCEPSDCTIHAAPTIFPYGRTAVSSGSLHIERIGRVFTLRRLTISFQTTRLMPIRSAQRSESSCWDTDSSRVIKACQHLTGYDATQPTAYLSASALFHTPTTSSSNCLFGLLGVQACQIRNPAHNIASFCVALPGALCRPQERHAPIPQATILLC